MHLLPERLRLAFARNRRFGYAVGLFFVSLIFPLVLGTIDLAVACSRGKPALCLFYDRPYRDGGSSKYVGLGYDIATYKGSDGGGRLRIWFLPGAFYGTTFYAGYAWTMPLEDKFKESRAQDMRDFLRHLATSLGL